MAKKLRTLLPVTDMAIGRFKGRSLFWKPGPEGYASGGVLKTTDYSGKGIDRHHWIVPDSASIGTFEIWGGGGNGAGSRCCQFGPDGGSGAYARKTVKLTPGDTYVFCTNIKVHCCYYTESDHNRSQRGGKTYVVGRNLSNFCAEGGNPGVTCCFVHANYKHNEYVYMCDVLARRVGDSSGDHFHRACYYGTNHGARGSYSIWQIGCCGGWHDSYKCGIQKGTAFPGGLFMWGRAERGGVLHGNIWINCQCSLDPHDGRSGRMRHGALGGAWYTRLPGEGGINSETSGGGCCCGSQGAFGAVRVTWE